ncbi:hypothetical protein [Paraburkholderia dipogonis]|jgi:hypothetical protein
MPLSEAKTLLRGSLPNFLHALLYDHAPMESFWGSPKTDLATRQDAREQARLGYLSPAAFTQPLFKNQPAA